MEAKTITINDNGIDKQFLLKPMTAVNHMKFTDSLLGIMAKSEMGNFHVFQQYLFSMMQTGIEVDGVNKSDLEKFAGQNLFMILFDAVKALLISADDKMHDYVLQKLFTCVTYINGGTVIQLTHDEFSENDINKHVASAATLYKIIFEVLKMHYANFFSIAGVLENLGVSQKS